MSTDRPARTLKCSACRSVTLSEEVEFSVSEGGLHFPDREVEGLLAPKSLRLRPRCARVCLTCGHVMMFLTADDLKLLVEAPRVTWATRA